MTLGDLLGELGRASTTAEFEALRDKAEKLSTDDRSSFAEAWLMVASARGVQVQ